MGGIAGGFGRRGSDPCSDAKEEALVTPTDAKSHLAIAPQDSAYHFGERIGCGTEPRSPEDEVASAGASSLPSHSLRRNWPNAGSQVHECTKS